ncbi:hypothetical protein [Rathayibacter sp. SD072]|uniref:hypothetical protein n=1 Tax=Rathayibacter sp. SD072 TaxID=2781731 RepID=UPI001A968A2A|nr:hypothetical protein [Rathayibacter sp. SD072]MBO0982692.1 hypothetical protein [Rathayibacter sp. SD072]
MKVLHKVISLAAAVAVGAGAALLGAPAAFAETSNSIELSEDDLSYFHATGDRFGVDKAVQEALLEKVRAGIPLDSSTGAEPVSVVTADVDGFTRTIETYADGSIIGSDIEIPKEVSADVAARGISQCVTSTSAGVNYGQDCWIFSSSMTIGASFYASYSRWASGSSVWNWHSPAINVVGGSVTSSSWNHVSGTNSSIQLQWNSQTGGIYTYGSWLKFNASPSGTSQTRGGTW